jgi:hypothetical protein
VIPGRRGTYSAAIGTAAFVATRSGTPVLALDEKSVLRVTGLAVPGMEALYAGEELADG